MRRAASSARRRQRGRSRPRARGGAARVEALSLRVPSSILASRWVRLMRPACGCSARCPTRTPSSRTLWNALRRTLCSSGTSHVRSLCRWCRESTRTSRPSRRTPWPPSSTDASNTRSTTSPSSTAGKICLPTLILPALLQLIDVQNDFEADADFLVRTTSKTSNHQPDTCLIKFEMLNAPREVK